MAKKREEKTIEGELAGLRVLLQTKREHQQQIAEEIQNISRAIVHLERGLNPEAARGLPALGIIEGAEQVFAGNQDAPMAVRHLTQQLIEMGVRTTSKRFAAAVYATLWNSPKFVRLGDGTWMRRSAAPQDAIDAWAALQQPVWDGTGRAKRSHKKGKRGK
jgi:hypothetical protein